MKLKQSLASRILDFIGFTGGTITPQTRRDLAACRGLEKKGKLKRTGTKFEQWNKK